MKKVLLIALLVFKLTHSNAQEVDTIPAYQKDSSHIPEFTVLKLDSTYTNERSVPKDEPLIIIYFSPTCGHCQITAEEFSKRMYEMRKYFFVWVSYSPLPEIKEFARAYGFQHYNNVLIGRDPNYYLPSYFRVKSTPFIAVYDKDHHLLQTFEKGTEADTIIDLLKEQ